MIGATSFVTINAMSPRQVEENLTAAEGHVFSVNIDFSLLITKVQNPRLLKTEYSDTAGDVRQKLFEPVFSNKVRKFVDDDEVEKLLTPYLEVLARHNAHLGIIYLCDEPYVAGISKLKMENEARLVRGIFEKHGMADIKLGITFASGMFDRQFAQLIESQASSYVRNIDDYAAERMEAIIFRGVEPSDFVRWVGAIRTSRLATYDLAGNMYTGGGIPAGFDVVGFDFYLSTILLDMTHEKSLSWFAENHLDESCRPYAGKFMKDVRKNLSFYGVTQTKPDQQRSRKDRKELDSIYNCRMGAVLRLLKRNLGSLRPQLLLISESSANGVMNFDGNGNVSTEQPIELIERRVLDEVRRAEKFYLSHVHEFRGGLIFFPYEDAYDASIKLKIGGVASMPKVMRSILVYSQSLRISTKDSRGVH